MTSFQIKGIDQNIPILIWGQTEKEKAKQNLFSKT